VKFHTIENWKHLWHRLWSVRFSLLAALLSIADTSIQYYVTGQPSIVVAGAACFSIAAAVSRIIAQDKLIADSYDQAP
jgi:hypothetical protein